MSIKKTFLRKSRSTSADVSILMTSMADIFIVLIIVLLKSYSSSFANMVATVDVSKNEATTKESIRVEITRDAVMIDQSVIVNLVNFDFPQSEIQDMRTGALTLSRLLREQRDTKLHPNSDSSIVVVADPQAPYSVVKRVIASASGSGFIDLQLIVSGSK